MYKKVALLLSSILLISCGGNSSTSGNNPEGGLGAMQKPLAVYNHAYQENFAADTVAEILANANNAYVLLETFDEAARQNISAIKDAGNIVGGYMSAGTGENWRDDFSLLEPYLTTTAWPQWPDEFFVSETTTGILPVMKARIDSLATDGVDWIEFDNMDWLDDDTRATYNLTASEVEAKAYINALCDYTHQKGIKCMAKNTVDGFSNFDGVLYESYHNEKNWWDTQGTASFLNLNKLVIINHYNETNCDAVYEEYKTRYNTDKISFICEDVATAKYKHYNQQ